MKHTRKLGFKIIVETNGRMFYYGSFCKDVKGLIDEIIIHYYGNDRCTHDRLTQTNVSYEQAIKGEKNISLMNVPLKKNIIDWLPANRSFMFDKPQEVVIEVTSRCNLDCFSCFNRASFAKTTRATKEMSTEFIKQIIDDISISGIPQVRFSGGEPLLREDLFELMEYAKSKSLRIWLNTNATLITKENIQQLEKYVENVLVAFNGYDEESDYKWTRTKKSFKSKLEGLELLKKSKIPVIRSGTVITSYNIDNLEKFFKIIRKNNLSGWELWRPILLKKTDCSLDLGKLLKKMAKLTIEYGKLVKISNAIPFCSHEPEKMDAFCLGALSDDGHSRLIVDSRGFAKPSYFIDENLGDPRKILKCWNHEFMKKIRNLETIPIECKKCKFLEKCKGGSRYFAKLFYNDYFASDPLAD